MSGSHFKPKWVAALSLLPAFVAMSAVPAARAQDVLAVLRACELEQDDSRRLACYDRALNRPPGKSVDQPSAQKPPHGASSSAAEGQFGMNEQLAHKTEGTRSQPRPDKLQARVTAVSYKPRGEPIVTLENGQVWESMEGSRPIELKVGDVVTIWPGLFGSYRLTTGDVVMRVSRVR